jgi:hypothetical protein
VIELTTIYDLVSFQMIDWLKERLGSAGLDKSWDCFCRLESGVIKMVFAFQNPADAVLFKLTWM